MKREPGWYWCEKNDTLHSVYYTGNNWLVYNGTNFINIDETHWAFVHPHRILSPDEIPMNEDIEEYVKKHSFFEPLKHGYLHHEDIYDDGVKMGIKLMRDGKIKKEADH
jgi:hypothetical protein